MMSLSSWMLSPHPRAAAHELTDKHVVYQAHALGRDWTQMAREVGVDLSTHPRKKGPYPDTSLSFAGCWALSTAGNFSWWIAYTLWVYAEYRHRYGGEHASRDYCSWAIAAIIEAGRAPDVGAMTTPGGVSC